MSRFVAAGSQPAILGSPTRPGRRRRRASDGPRPGPGRGDRPCPIELPPSAAVPAARRIYLQPDAEPARDCGDRLRHGLHAGPLPGRPLGAARLRPHPPHAAGRGLAGRRAAVRPGPGDARPGHRHRARQRRQGEPLRVRDASLPRHPADDLEEQREAYRHLPIDLAEARFYFLNTLFSLSGSCLFAQLVDLYDQRRFPEVLGYHDLFQRINRHLDTTHLEGTLKAEILADPEPYIDLDPNAPLALLDQRRSGKRLLIITNAEWSYVRAVMAYAFDRFLPEGMTWRDLFELVIVGARKPDFFSASLPLFSIVDEERGPAGAGGAGLPRAGLLRRRRRRVGRAAPRPVGRRDPVRRRPHLR